MKKLQNQLIDKVCDERDSLRTENARLLLLLADIRSALGDPEGKMMQEDFVEYCKEVVGERDRLRELEKVARKIYPKRMQCLEHHYEGQLEEPDDDWFDDEEGEYCDACDEFGMYVICVDDLCHSGSGCIHGDGEIVCPYCKGNGKLW